jgi:hypothetical protein
MYMSKPSLHLIHSSNGGRPGEKSRRTRRSFRPFVIDSGVKSVPSVRSWDAAPEPIDVGFLAFYRIYLAYLEASATVLGAPYWIDPEKTRLD